MAFKTHICIMVIQKKDKISYMLYSIFIGLWRWGSFTIRGWDTIIKGFPRRHHWLGRTIKSNTKVARSIGWKEIPWLITIVVDFFPTLGHNGGRLSKRKRPYQNIGWDNVTYRYSNVLTNIWGYLALLLLGLKLLETHHAFG